MNTFCKNHPILAGALLAITITLVLPWFFVALEHYDKFVRTYSVVEGCVSN